MATVKLTETLFGVTNNNNEIKKYTLSTPDGFEVSLINYGATIQSIRQPDKNNQISEVTLGYDTLQEYVDDKNFFGCTVGRVTNRIKNGRFELDGTTYELPKDDGTKKHYLHGAFHKRVWDSSTENNDTVIFKYQSPDGESGFPGQVDATVKYILSSDHQLKIDYHATTTKSTPINMTNHAYFNLGGDASGTILDHQLIVPADKIISLDDEHIPTGEIASVENTPFDFRTLTRVGDHINESFTGYDIMLLVNGEGKRPFGKLVHGSSGRAMTIESTQKGIQFYTADHLDGGKGHNGTAYDKHAALCLEIQNYSDSVNNQPQFPTTILLPGEEYHEQTTFHFHLE
ncbi:unnamed protein product [Rotaria socialis]|uniref:Aldose 1-epimerase n=1 Tax=Rotaria socialis TaxID=392032 RepID=A0A821GJ42_9BILA|nr:unnamed protein product [Rotaria socialis]CAF3338520.1 unnamed protein product [Rotaria socialis]CAF3397376.1 unnamed protein product [Rotaria socialis]CAF3512759.1 unnamed protein product [Rotaria socialis]CAF3709222.1 unnamed protein product [Rotaria socialis]